MKVVVCSMLLMIVVTSGQRLYRPPSTNHASGVDVPTPYSFRYVAVGDEGQSSHEESSDGYGRVQGSYSLSDIDGHSRVVEYIADEDGYRAIVRTNEPGTANQNPADVIIESTADTDGYRQPGRGGDGYISRPGGLGIRRRPVY